MIEGWGRQVWAGGEGRKAKKIWGALYVQNKYTLYMICNDRKTGHETDKRSLAKKKGTKIEGEKKG